MSNSPVSAVTIRAAVERDAPAIAALHNHYVQRSTATFEESSVSVSDMASRILAVLSVPLPWLIAERENALVGYTYASKWRTRSGYRFSVEVSVYVDPKCSGEGVGSMLYRALLERLREANVHAVMGGIALPNDASIALHEKFGFTKVAHFRDVGFKFGQWIDVGYWHTLL